MKAPSFLYGTAWKEDATEDCVTRALEAGFRGIDTANQRKHYFEAGVGEALKKSGLPRSEYFLQTKFTLLRGQDHRLPYDPKASLTEQVEQSFANSLEHLHTDYLDSYVLHGPSGSAGLTSEDWEIWKAMEGLQRSGKVRELGVSNVSASQLCLLWEGAEVKPAYAQIRTYASRGWERETRKICAERGIVFQGFSLLTANRNIFEQPQFLAIQRRLGCTGAQLVFRFALALGMLPLTGTRSGEHMLEDLASASLPWSRSDQSTIEALN